MQLAIEAKLQKVKEKRDMNAHRNYQLVKDREQELRAKEERLRHEQEAFK